MSHPDSQTPRIDAVLASPEALTFDVYQQAAHETAAYETMFPEQPDKVIPFLLRGLLCETLEATGTKAEYAMLMLNVVPDLPPEMEATMAKEPADMLWYVAEIATQSELSLGEVVNKQLYDSRFGSVIRPKIDMDTYQDFCDRTPEIGTRTSKIGFQVSTLSNPILTGTKMLNELYAAFDLYEFHPLATPPRLVSKEEALGSMTWWISTVLSQVLGVSLETAARNNLAKLRSRFERGTDVLLHQSGDNR